MWESPDPDVPGCVYDTTDCGHICKGCLYGVIECPRCKEYISHDESRCPSCGRTKFSILYEGDFDAK
jgi:hypothetical protein